jgi:hypothetical protein
MNKILKNYCLFMIFGAIYGLIETIWKGHITHWSMFILGGLAGVLIGSINEYIPWDIPFWKQCVIGMILATLLEGIIGIIVNVHFNLGIWHYTELTFFYNQCSIPFCIAWFFLSGFCIMLDDWFRWQLFGEEKPHYRLK